MKENKEKETKDKKKERQKENNRGAPYKRFQSQEQDQDQEHEHIYIHVYYVMHKSTVMRSLNHTAEILFSLQECEIEDLVSEIPKFCVEETSSPEGNITSDEAGSALRNMDTGKSPGSDGFSAEFLNCLVENIGTILCQSLK